MHSLRSLITIAAVIGLLAAGFAYLADNVSPLAAVALLLALAVPAANARGYVLGAVQTPLQSNRTISDAALSANIAMPNANATTFSTFIDLGATQPFPTTEGISLAAVIPAIANLANTKTITISVEDADANANANAAALSLVGSFDVTGGASGSAAITKFFKLPGITRRFVRLKAVGGGNAGTTITETGTGEIRV